MIGERSWARARARHLAADARHALTVARGAGLFGAFGPRAIARVIRDTVAAPRPGGLAVVHAHATAAPERLAIISGEHRFTYGELDARVNRLTHALAALGVGAGDRVGLYLKNGHEFFELHLALQARGAIGVQIGYRLKADEVAYILGNSGAVALFFHHELAPVVEEILARPEVPLHRARAVATRELHGFPSYEAVLQAQPADAPHAVRGAGWGGVMLYTSGTTGRNKGARRDFRQMGLSAVLELLAALPLQHDERHLAVCPLYHALAAIFVAPIIVLGGCIVVMEHFDPASVLSIIERERITSTLMVPTMLARLLALPEGERHAYDTGSLRWVMSGAAPLPVEVARGVEDWLGPVLYNLYGATETGLVTLARPGEHTARPGTIGRPIADNELRLLDTTGRDVAAGEIGELYVRNGMLMDGYYGDEAATRAASREGFISVGDLAVRDADGYYYLKGRTHDLVISGGVNIYPSEIEQRLLEHPGVADVAVAGVPDPDWGESLVAWVVPHPGEPPSAAALIEFVRARLADYKRPRHVVFVEELPRNPTGKVLKRELRARFLDEHARSKP